MEHRAGIHDQLTVPDSQESDPVLDSNLGGNFEHLGENSELNHSEIEVEEVAEDTPHPDLSNYQLARDRGRREVRPPTRFGYANLIYCALIAGAEMKSTKPSCYEEAIKSREHLKWKQAMDEEMASLKLNGTWKLVAKPENHKLVKCKWLYKLKEGMNKSDPIRYKARLVAKGFTQREGIDYTEIFSPVVRFKTIRLMLAIVAHFDLELEQLDVKQLSYMGI